jgi:flagellar protein FliS
MPADAARLRYLADAVATASPARRVVLLYDRLWLDLERAGPAMSGNDPIAAGNELLHAQQILAELLGSLDPSGWSGAANLADLYAYLLGELSAVIGDHDRPRLEHAARIVSDLRSTWQQAELQLQAAHNADPRAVARVG